jgi:uncharacterized protein (TIGR04255 family)
MPIDLPPADERVSRRSSVSTVVCQIGFDERPRVGEGSFPIEFHERLGGPTGRYPKLEPAAEQRLILEVGTAPSQQQISRRGWSFESQDRGWSLALLPDSVALQADDAGYAGWEDFLGRVRELLEALEDMLTPSIAQRVGLRFVDRIQGSRIGVGEPGEWAPYIEPAFLGLLALPGIGPAVQGGQQQHILDAGDGARCQLRHGLALVTGGERSVYVIDCDLFRDGVRQFDRMAILGTMGSFREQVDRVFGAAASPALLDALSQ